MDKDTIFSIEEYKDGFKWVNENQDYTIKEIEPVNSKRTFKFVLKDEVLNPIENLRIRRQEECFSIINRGMPWYNKLTDEQKSELNKWYSDWLDVTETKVIPNTPTWLNKA